MYDRTRKDDRKKTCTLGKNDHKELVSVLGEVSLTRR